MRALARLAAVLPPSAYLAGGVAVSLRYRHRTSADLDLFTPDDSLDSIVPALEAMHGVEITLRRPRTLYAVVDGIPASILTYAYPHLAEPQQVAAIAVPVASVPDLITMKLAALADRGAARDFWDLHELLTNERISLPDALELFRRRFPKQDIGHILRALVYFADAEAAPLPTGLDATRWAAIKSDFASWVHTFAAP